MEAVVYVLCAVTCCLSAILLFRAYRSKPSRLLFWAAICFSGITFGNVVMIFDLTVFYWIDLRPYRNAIGLFSITSLLYGLVWDVV